MSQNDREPCKHEQQNEEWPDGTSNSYKRRKETDKLKENEAVVKLSNAWTVRNAKLMKSNSRAKLFKKNAEDADEFASSARTSDCNSISQQVRKAQKTCVK